MGGNGGDPTGGGLLVVVALVEGVLFKTVLKKLPLPYTCIMLILGVLTGLVLQYGDCTYVGEPDIEDALNQTLACKAMRREICMNPLHTSRESPSHENDCEWQASISDLGPVGNTVDLWTNIDPHLVMYTFLPPLIYGATVHVNVHVFKHTLGQVLPLAGPGVLLATFLTASFTKMYIGDTYHWSTWAYLTFGAMLSATDPVAVVALLSESSAPPKLGIIIEGESLFNDGTALAVFLICFEGIKGNEEDFGGALLFFARLAVGGMIMGILMGRAMLYILKYLQEPLLEVIITLIFSYGTFFVAEQESVHVSGVIALVFLGLSMAAEGQPLLTSEDMMHHFWEMMDFIANTVVFHVSGLIIAQTVMDEHITSTDWGFLIVLFLALIAIRSIVLLCLSPMLFVSGYGVTWYELIFVSWSGLRGAVGLALGMMVEATNNDEIACASSFDYEDGVCGSDDKDVLRARMLFHMAGIATLTLLVNGTTGEYFLMLLGLERRSNASLMSYDAAARLISVKNVERFNELSKQPFFKSMDKDIVWDHMPVLSEEILHERRWAKRINEDRFANLEKGSLIRTLRRRYASKSSPGYAEGGGVQVSSNVVVPLNMEISELDWPEHWDQFTREQREDLYKKYWLQILEQRRRFVAMLEANLWHSFESGSISRSTVLLLTELCACVRDRVMKSPKRAPNTPVERARHTTNSWPLLEPQLMPSIFDHIIQRILELPCFKGMARRRLYKRINSMLDITRGYIDVHKHSIHTMEGAITKLAESIDETAESLDDRDVHTIHPVVVEMVVQEAHRAELAASKFYKEISSGESGMMTRSIATNYVIRRLLADATSTIQGMHEHGQIDSVEKVTMMRCVHANQRRLLMNPVFQKPPTTADMLKGQPFLRGLDKKDFEKVMNSATEKHIHVNTVLFSQGDVADCIYVLLSGTLSLHVKAELAAGRTSGKRGRKGKRTSLVILAAQTFTKILQKGKSLAIDSKIVEDTTTEKDERAIPKKTKKRRRLSLQDQDVMDARTMTTEDIDQKHGAEMLRVTAGHVVGSLSMARGSKRMMTAIARDTMAVVVAIPKTIIGQCFEQDANDDNDDEVLRVATRTATASRKHSMWLYGSQSSEEHCVEKKKAGEVLILEIAARRAAPRSSLFGRSGQRRSLWGRNRSDAADNADSDHANRGAEGKRRLSLSRKARRSLFKSKTARNNNKACFAQAKQREELETKLSTRTKPPTKKSPTGRGAQRRGSAIGIVAAKLTKQSFRRVVSYTPMEECSIQKLEASICKESAAIAAKVFLDRFFLGMDYDDVLQTVRKSMFVRVSKRQKVILKNSAILLTGRVIEPRYMASKGVSYLKVDDDDMEDGVSVTVGVDSQGRLPRLLIVPPRQANRGRGRRSLFGGNRRTSRMPPSFDKGDTSAAHQQTNKSPSLFRAFSTEILGSFGGG